MRTDLVIKNARTLSRDSPFDIAISEGKICEIGQFSRSSGQELDAQGKLVLPTFIEPHVHLDKALLSKDLGEASSISEAREMVRGAKKKFTLDSVTERIEKVIPWALESGVTIVRTHLDVDNYAKTTSVEAVLQLKKKYWGIMDFQIVAFPQEGITKDPGIVELLRKSLEMGATVLGGLPEAEGSHEAGRKQIDELFSLSKEFDVDVDLHCDVLPNYKNIEYFTSCVLKNHYQERATADHLIALAYYDDAYASEIIRNIAAARINVITNPCTMIASGRTERPPMGRGLTRVKELLKAGVNVAFGSDNIMDPYNPLGDFNPLSNGFLLTYGAQLSSLSEMEKIIHMPTYSSAKILRLTKYGIDVGGDADLNIFTEATATELLRKHGRPCYVIKKGKVLVENVSESKKSERIAVVRSRKKQQCR